MTLKLFGEQLENETLFSIGYYLLLAVASKNKKICLATGTLNRLEISLLLTWRKF